MKKSRRILSFGILLTTALFVGISCRRDNSLIYLNQNEFAKADWKEIVKADPIGKDENIKVIALGEVENASYHLVQIRDKEEPHVHPDNDLMVLVKRGKGVIHIGDKEFDIKKGAFMVIPKGTTHYYENRCGCGSVALAIFTPPLR